MKASNLYVLTLLVGMAGCSADDLEGSIEEDLRRSHVRPVVECVWDNGDGTFDALFGYDNKSADTVYIERGRQNKIRRTVAGKNNQPEYFLPGRQSEVFKATGKRLVVWRVGRQKVVARRSTSPCATKPETGRSLFEEETFAGNGRTCLTCHSRETGTLSPSDIAELSASDPLFLFDGADNFQSGDSRIREHGTILVEIPLPDNVRLLDDPDASSVVLRRGIPSTLNTPALDEVLMQDGRAPDLMAQASDAIAVHAQSAVGAAPEQLQKIAELQQTGGFFSSKRLADFAFGLAPAPQLPQGATEAERRGRVFFEDRPVGPNMEGICALCHSGPMLNETNEFLQQILPEDGPGLRFFNLGIGTFNDIGNPVRTYVFTDADGNETMHDSPDPGLALITGDPKNLDQFKITSLWGSTLTAPYFHDNSAKTLEEMMDFYDRLFQVQLGVGFSEEQIADIIAYLKLLN